MKCPLDNTPLQMTERKGVEIDYCPECRGIWLDRGELDKMIGQSQEYQSHEPMKKQPPEYRQDNHQKEYRQNDEYKHHSKKKESFLSDLFDF